MEDQFIVMTVVVIGVFSLIGVKMLRPGQVKTKQKTRISAANDTLDKVNDDTIIRLSDQLKKEAGRANKLQALKDKAEGLEDEEQGVSFEEIEALVKQNYPKYAMMLHIPGIKKQVMEMTKGMTLQQILEYVGQITGNKKSQGGSDPQSLEYNKDWA